MSAAPVLQVANLEVLYHDVVRGLRGISLDVPEGAVVALLGPNGAGKTTTIRAVTGLLPICDGRVSKGRILLDGEPITDVAPERIVARGVGHVPEGRRVFAELTVEENLRSGAWGRSGRAVRSELDRWYARFPVLAQRRRGPAGYLSGGEQQMLAIARSLMARPRLLLLDEPSLGLAPQIVADVAELVREINAEGVAILLVEQNAAVSLSLADHAYVLETGRIVKEGTSDELLADADIQEFYLGVGDGGRRSFREVKHYRRRKRWLS